MGDKGYTLVNYCEINEFASTVYCAIHNETEARNLGDITKVDETAMEEFNMICGGSPCQDFSVAGAKAGSVWKCVNCEHTYNPLTVHFSKRGSCPVCGSEDLNKSRSSLLVEWLRIIQANKPKWGIYENVKAITNKNFKDTFHLFLAELEEYGYNVYWQVLNAKDYGIPQNRDRAYIFIVDSKLDNGKFRFPEPFTGDVALHDLLEKSVDVKYNLSRDRVDRVITDLNKNNSLLYDTCQIGREGKSREYNDYSPTLNARDYKEPRLVNINRLTELSTGKTDYSSVELRKMLPLEYYRIMGFSDKEFFRAMLGDYKRAEEFLNNYKGLQEINLLQEAEKLQKVSNTQLYMQAGNSIVVDVLYHIYSSIYKAMPYIFDDLRLCSFFSGAGAFESGLDRLFNKIKSGDLLGKQVDLYSLL